MPHGIAKNTFQLQLKSFKFAICFRFRMRSGTFSLPLKPQNVRTSRLKFVQSHFSVLALANCQTKPSKTSPLKQNRSRMMVLLIALTHLVCGVLKRPVNCRFAHLFAAPRDKLRRPTVVYLSSHSQFAFQYQNQNNQKMYREREREREMGFE